MWLKVVIVFLFIGLAVSLFTGFGFLMKNRGRDQESKAVWYSLSVRLIIATLLMGVIIYGIYTGQLGSQAPWDMHGVPLPAAQPAPADKP